MRTILCISVLLIAMAMLTSCDNPVASNDVTMFGSWHGAEQTITFNADSSYSMIRQDGAIDVGLYSVYTGDSTIATYSVIEGRGFLKFFQVDYNTINLSYRYGNNYMSLDTNTSCIFTRQ